MVFEKTLLNSFNTYTYNKFNETKKKLSAPKT